MLNKLSRKVNITDNKWFLTHKYSNLLHEINQLFIVYVLPLSWTKFSKYSQEIEPKLLECWGDEISNAKQS